MAVDEAHHLDSAHRGPWLSPDAHQAYKENLLERLESFPQPPETQDLVSLIIPKNVNVSVDYLRGLPWNHELRHDAKSVFWLLVRWAIHLRSRTGNQIPKTPHRSVTTFIEIWLVSIQQWGRKDNRILWPSLPKANLGWTLSIKNWSLYSGRWPTNSTVTCTEYGGPKEMKDPEFPNEAMQRIIFNFLMEHRTNHSWDWTSTPFTGR